jgi:ketosteroid isomerase-like protein
MKIACILVAIVIAAAPAVSAQTPDSKQKPAAAKAATSDVEQTLMKMERDALAALLKRDTVGFGRIFADDAVLITPDGTPQTKSQLLADVKSGDLLIESSEITDMKVRAYGDAAVVTYVTTDKGTYKGQDISGRYRWTDIFVRAAGTWHIVAGQGTRIQPPPK